MQTTTCLARTVRPSGRSAAGSSLLGGSLLRNQGLIFSLLADCSDDILLVGREMRCQCGVELRLFLLEC